MQVPFIDLPAQHAQIREAVMTRMEAVCASGRFVLGPEVEAFERAFAAYCETKHCVAMNSGTSALHLALLCLNVAPGDEVITVPMTFAATAWAISYVGATPVFVDIDPLSRTMDPERLEKAITKQTRAIVPVHLHGTPADMDSIQMIAQAYGLPVVEDAAQAHGALYQRWRAGSLGKLGCFSFYPAKNLGAYGEGGALVTNDSELAFRARVLRNHGQVRRYCHEEIGYNYRMDELQGAVLNVKLPFLDDWNERRRQHARQYQEGVSHLKQLRLPSVLDGRQSVFHMYVIEVENRDQVAAKLNEAGIQTGLHYPLPLHLQPAYKHLGLLEGRFPVSEHFARHCLSLPMYPELTSEQIAYVCRTLEKCCGEGK